jgi:hemerythrin superfamily protein
MTPQRHNEIMTNIMKQLDKDDLNLADGISIWHSLGTFLFSNIDKENRDISKIYDTMQEYLADMQKLKQTK